MLRSIDRRKFLRGSGVALAVPHFGSLFPVASAVENDEDIHPRRLACFYFPDGVPMPLPEDPAYKDWSWFPHGNGGEFEYTRCFSGLQSLRSEFTVISGLSHPPGRTVHGHNNADQFLTGAPTGGGDTEYSNSISLDQVYAAYAGEKTRISSLVMSTDGGIGTARGTHTMSFNQNGRPIPAENRPKQLFDTLFVKDDASAAQKLAVSSSALDSLLEDARSLRARLSEGDREHLEQYLDAVRTAEIRVAKAKRWLNTPLPDVDADHLNLELTPDEPRMYVRTMFDLIYLAFRTDSTRVATYQIGRENGVGKSDHLARAVGYSLAHQLSHETKQPGGWERFATYCGFLNEELGIFLSKLRDTPEPTGGGPMLDNTVVLFGSASSAFHLSRNYPLILAGGRRLGFQHGRFLNHIGMNAQGGAWDGGREPWQQEITHDDLPLGNLFLTMLRRLGVKVDSFAHSTGELANI